MATFGFVAGTLVHTDEGLVAIEQLKVGTMVLSRPENNSDAPNEYKRVLSTFKSAGKKKITYVSYDVIEDGAGTGNRYLFCTEDHPFWTMTEPSEDEIEDLGWQAANTLSMQDIHLLKTYNNCFALVTDYDAEQKGIYEIDNSKITFLYNENDDSFATYDFRSGQPVCIGGHAYSNLHPSEAKSAYDMETQPEILELIERKSDIYFDHVYNIEVEDFHTYYVGEAGIWVHALA
jgi:transcription-repair coupling factor (superfamily II helicase)